MLPVIIYMTKDTSVLQNISSNVWKLKANSNIYLIKLDRRAILVDAGDRAFRRDVEMFLAKMVDFDKIQKVFFTHLHFDHIGNFDLFRNAEFYASAREIEDLKRNKIETTLNTDISEKFNINLKAFDKDMELKVIETPGHTRGSVCFWYEKEKLLFTGDTIFKKNILGRTDLPTSIHEMMNESILKLLNYNFKKMCPGHDY